MTNMRYFSVEIYARFKFKIYKILIFSDLN